MNDGISANPEPLPWETEEWKEKYPREPEADLSKCHKCKKNEPIENSFLCKGCKEVYIYKQQDSRIRGTRTLSREDLKIMQAKVRSMGKTNQYFNDVAKIFSPVNSVQMGLQTT